MPTPFPGMDPYLEQPALWKQIHTTLIVDIRRYLAPLIRPQYLVAIEERNLRTLTLIDSLPEPIKVIERYLEVRDAGSGEVITVIEILSPSNKLEDRQRYERKRRRVLNSMTNLVEIDLLRSGKPMSMVGEFPKTAYRILVSRALQRPEAQVFPCGLRQPIPEIPIPLRPGEDEPLLPLNQLLHTLYDSAGYDLFIDYRKPPVPPLSEDDMLWAQQRLVAAEQ